MAQLPKWWPRRGQADQFDNLTAQELVEIDPHGLLEAELQAYLRAIRRAFGAAAYELMVGPGLPDPAEEWLEEAFPDGDRMYSFLQCLHDWPFDLSSESDSEESGSDEESDSDNEKENDEGPNGPPSPPPPPPGAEEMEA